MCNHQSEFLCYRAASGVSKVNGEPLAPPRSMGKRMAGGEGGWVWVSNILTHLVKHSGSAVTHWFFVRTWNHSA